MTKKMLFYSGRGRVLAFWIKFWFGGTWFPPQKLIASFLPPPRNQIPTGGRFTPSWPICDPFYRRGIPAVRVGGFGSWYIRLMKIPLPTWGMLP